MELLLITAAGVADPADIADRCVIRYQSERSAHLQDIPLATRACQTSGDDVYRVTVQASDGSMTDYFEALHQRN